MCVRAIDFFYLGVIIFNYLKVLLFYIDVRNMKLIICDGYSVLIRFSDNVILMVRGFYEGGNIFYFFLKNVFRIWWVGICVMYFVIISNFFDIWWVGFLLIWRWWIYRWWKDWLGKKF